jgi:hypothetical protein
MTNGRCSFVALTVFNFVSYFWHFSLMILFYLYFFGFCILPNVADFKYFWTVMTEMLGVAMLSLLLVTFPGVCVVTPMTVSTLRSSERFKKPGGERCSFTIMCASMYDRVSIQ